MQSSKNIRQEEETYNLVNVYSGPPPFLIHSWTIEEIFQKNDLLVNGQRKIVRVGKGGPMTPTNIKPCKRCGATRRTKRDKRPILHRAEIGPGWHVYCQRCGYYGPIANYDDEAVYLWNSEKRRLEMDIIKELSYVLNGTEVAFFSVVLQKEKGEIKPTYTIMGEPSEDIKNKLSDAMRKMADRIKQFNENKDNVTFGKPEVRDDPNERNHKGA